jgi:hypothetical protein
VGQAAAALQEVRGPLPGADRAAEALVKEPIIIKSYRDHPDACPCCGYVVDTATAVGSRVSKPKAGDLTICLRCGEILKFNAELRLEMFPLNELLTASPEKKEMIDLLTAFVREQRAKGVTISPSNKERNQ